jgi:hypothetical protein
MAEQDELDMLDELLDLESGLTAWEMDFLESLDRQRERKWSDPQRDKLSQIAERLDKGGLL